MDLHEAAQELYAVLPRDFTSERTTLVRTAKEAGHKELAQEIGRLPKPAAGAWAINMLAVHKPEVIDGVVRFGASLRAAQEESDAAAFRELSQQRQGQLTTAVHAAKDLAGELGAPLSAAAATDVEQTLRAAMADSGAARAVATGRLVRALSGSGFESVDLTDAVAAASAEDIAGTNSPTGPAAEPARKKAADTKETSRAKDKAEDGKAEKNKAPRKQEAKEQATSLADRRAAKRQAALKEAQNEFDAADTKAQDAEKRASEAWEVVNELARRRSEVQAEIDEVKKRLATLEAEVIGIVRDTESAESDKKLAVRTATQLRRSADQAQRRVDRLG
ncbi:coiled-coil domain-containing protein [Paenarthrobacter histidinolovorans]|uniref:DNA repair exonuclease SbcCD ATPase subunit n=1 Tax=Paenarthrobacter histidinolovorans TaxID=43664 RepID=A0ABW8N5T9_9MICC